LIDAKAIERMREGAVLINTARGGVVDEDALAAALISGRLGGAALDVFETEPLTLAEAARFKGVPNLILTPHIAGPTQESNARVSTITAENIRRALESQK
jgi:(S)-sulfolactate dehydrogenase